MKKIKSGFFILFKSIVLVLAIFLFFWTFGCNSDNNTTSHRPVVFVHGGAGSADQFETQALRFASNGYPKEWITGFEYDSFLLTNTLDQVITRLDEHIDNVLLTTGADKVDLLGHSFGGINSHTYISDPERAKKVAHYCNLDGFLSDVSEGLDVPILAIWASMSGLTGRQVVDAVDNIMLYGVTHVQAASHADSFYHMYKFFNDGEEPATTDVLPEDTDNIKLAGRAINFAINSVLTDLAIIVELYEVNGSTGFRINSTPLYRAPLNADGSFGPFTAKAGKYYEFNLQSETDDSVPALHYYYEPFIRSDYMIRLKTDRIDGILNSIIERGDNHCAIAIIRNKEFVGDAQTYPAEQMMANDSLKVAGQELFNADIVPASKHTIGFFLFDSGSDGKNDLSQCIGIFGLIPFISGVDFYLPASETPDGSISIILKSRKVAGTTNDKLQILNVPNWASSNSQIFVQFNDFIQ